MSRPILILGQSGSGKSSSIKTLPPKETFIINVCRKELPFRGAEANYTELSKQNPDGNMLLSDNYSVIGKTLEHIEKTKDKIKYYVVDDSQYLIVNEFMNKHSTHGKGNEVFSLYNTIADNFWKLLWNSKMYGKDKFFFFLHHCETTEAGQVKAKTIGKMLDEKIDIPGMFTTVLLCKREGSENFFLTQNDGFSPAKSPDGMFSEIKIPNDLLLVANQITSYYKGA
jgi:hypothetical protein